jgi:hypothetical protein
MDGDQLAGSEWNFDRNIAMKLRNLKRLSAGEKEAIQQQAGKVRDACAAQTR